MLLIVGGAGQGKRKIALEQTGCTQQDIGEDREIVDHLHLLIRKYLEQGWEISPLLEKMLNKQAVLCDEIGCGVDVYKRQEQLVQVLKEHDCLENASFIQNCGLPEEVICRDLTGELPKTGYFTTMVIQEKKDVYKRQVRILEEAQRMLQIESVK